MLAITLIDRYQSLISPRKGFLCPYRLLHGRDSCSEHGKRILARFGWRRGLLLLERRILDCREAAILLQSEQAGDTPPAAPGPARKGGNCSCGDTLQAVDCGFSSLECLGDIASCF